MQALHGGALRTHAVSIPFVLVAVIAPGGAITAQSVHPFAAPTTTGSFSRNSVAGLVDCNRDGSRDVIVPGLFFGTFVTALDEDGNGLAANSLGPNLTATPGAPTTPMAIAIASGHMDQDAREDLMTVTSCGTVHFHRNLGSTRLGQCDFAPDVIVDNFLAAYPINPPFVSYSFPVLQRIDFDRDGHQDVLLGGGPLDRWAGSTRPGFVAFYRGNGTGAFQVTRYNLPGSVVDMEVADLDNNGVHDHIVVLTETGSVGAFGYELVHLTLVNGALVPVGFPQSVGPGKLTALELADVMGDANLDYILAQTLASGGALSSQIYYLQGDGQGQVSNSQWGTFTLPPNLTNFSDYVCSIQVGDWNYDTHVDFAILRGFVQPASPASSVAPVHGNSEVLVAMGPNVAYAPFQIIALPGYHRYSSTYNQLFPLLPLFGEPDFLRTIDLGNDHTDDLLIPGLRTPSGATPTVLALLKNLTPPLVGDMRMQKVGNPSGGVASSPARIGFDGGTACPGNSNFACTIQNVQGGCLVGLMWSPVGIANLFSAYGLVFNLAPTEFGYGAIASGALPRAGFHSYPLPIPNVVSLVGDAGYFQYCYYDHVSGAFGGTQATGLSIGN